MKFLQSHSTPQLVNLSAVLLLVLVTLLSIASPVEAASSTQSAEEGQSIFEQKCIACHTIGGGTLVGPDLLDVTSRRDQDWLVSFITAPDQVLAGGDPIAAQLLSEHNNVRMPNLGISQTEALSILAYLQDQSGAPQPQGGQLAKLPPGDLERGRNLFSGAIPLANGGIACMSCHNVEGIGQLGGGSLGPDLTHVYQRFGHTGLSSSLQSLPFPTMQGVYANQPLSPQEQADLLALFQQADTQTAGTTSTTLTSAFLALGVGGAALLFLVMVFFWPRQRRSLSERLRKGAG